MGRMELLRAQMTQSLLAAGGGKACGCATTVPRQLLPKQGLNDPFMQKTQQGAAPLLLQALGPLRLPPPATQDTNQAELHLQLILLYFICINKLQGFAKQELFKSKQTKL